jgi:hypothetical protein
LSGVARPTSTRRNGLSWDIYRTFDRTERFRVQCGSKIFSERTTATKTIRISRICIRGASTSPGQSINLYATIISKAFKLPTHGYMCLEFFYKLLPLPSSWSTNTGLIRPALCDPDDRTLRSKFGMLGLVYYLFIGLRS